MKARVVIMFILISCTVFSQDIYMFKVKVFEKDSNRPITFKEAILYDGQIALDNSFSDEKGTFTFIIDSSSFNSDSVYILIITENSHSNNLMIFINNLKLLKYNKISNYSIMITDFKLFTQEEYIKYCKKNGLIPRRKKTFAKDVK